MSKENLDSYELFFAEIPQNNDDFLSQIITRDKTNTEKPQPHSNSGLSTEQVKQIGQDVRELDRESNPAPIVPKEGTLFPEDI